MVPVADIAQPPLAQELGEALLPELDEISRGMATRLHGAIPELAAAGDGPLYEETYASCRANVGRVLRGIANDEPATILDVAAEAVDYAQAFVRRDISLAALLRTYRVGQAYFWERWSAAMIEHATDSARVGTALAASSSWVFAYIDHVATRLIEVYDAAASRWSHTPDAMRAETARALLRGTLRDEASASAVLGYRLERRAHLGLVVWDSRGPGRPEQLSRASAAAAQALSAKHPLIVPAGASESWVWCAAPDDPAAAPQTLRDLQINDGIRIAVGRARPGLAGFRRTHGDAIAAARIARVSDADLSAVTAFDEIELVSLLCEDIDRARAFVADELGLLAGPGEPLARLRETALVCLQEGMSKSRAAGRLFVHQNTVAYRMARVQELLSHRLPERRFQVTAALMLVQVLGQAILDDRIGG